MNAEKETALLNAIENNNLKVAAQLLAEGVDVNRIREHKGYCTALSLASMGNNLNLVCLLVEHGANVEFTNQTGTSILGYILQCMTYDALKYILSTGARVNRRYIHGDTILHKCVEIKCIKLFLRNGAVLKKNEDGYTPLIYHAWVGQIQAVALLHEHIDKSDTPHIEATFIVDYVELTVDCIQSFLTEVPVQRSSLSGDVLIGCVSRELFQDCNEKPLSLALIQRFVSQAYRMVCLERRSEDGLTLIEHACTFESSVLHHNNGNVDYKLSTLKLLLRLGAEPNGVDFQGQTVVGYVLKSCSNHRPIMHCLLRALMQAGAHLDAYRRDDDGASLDDQLCNYLRENSISPVRNGRLTCLTATTMRYNGLTFSNPKVKAYLPQHLFTHLAFH